MRGKTSSPNGNSGQSVSASMRPPQNAGEDLWTRDEVVGPGFASMRPPQNAGEDDEARRAA